MVPYEYQIHPFLPCMVDQGPMANGGPLEILKCGHGAGVLMGACYGTGGTVKQEAPGPGTPRLRQGWVLASW